MIRGIGHILANAEIPLGGLDQRVSERDLDLLQSCMSSGTGGIQARDAGRTQTHPGKKMRLESSSPKRREDTRRSPSQTANRFPIPGRFWLRWLALPLLRYLFATPAKATAIPEEIYSLSNGVVSRDLSGWSGRASLGGGEIQQPVGTLAPHRPMQEYVYLNGKVVVVENGPW
jgi:hypothetical protein